MGVFAEEQFVAIMSEGLTKRKLVRRIIEVKAERMAGGAGKKKI